MENFERNIASNNAFTETDEMLLWSFIDGIATEEEQQKVMQFIDSNVLWKTKYEAVLEVNEHFFSMDTHQPSMRFTKNVMDQVAQYSVAPSARTYVNKNIFRTIGSLFVALTIGCLIIVLKNIDWHMPSSNSLGTKTPIDVQHISHIASGNTIVYSLLFLNIIFGFYFLDRYLAGKRKQRHHLTKV